ncbi:FAD/FMN-containing dehydrogenase [Streptomyces sp. SAI-170]|uniref:FAD-binding oxidoreductase n=1 Tax=Streptomyces sp. SAI-170 TaxID=3377729 RepID=UPI003C7E3C21
MTAVSATAQLAERLRRTTDPGRVTTAGPEYEASRTVWNGAVESRPAVVLRCADAGDVQAGVTAARELGVPLSVRGGGHGWTGGAILDGGLLLDLSGMRRITLDQDAGVADVQGGARAMDVAQAAEAAGRIAVTGTSGSVGIVGFTLAGGYGPLGGRYGLGIDNVVAVDLVLADGTAVTADAEHEPELLWALRGGGGNFGVVTSIRVRVHPLPGGAADPTVVGGTILYPWDQASSVLKALGEQLPTHPDELTVTCGLFTGPAGSPLIYVAPTWCGDPDTGRAAVEPLTRLGDPVMAQVGPTRMTETLAATDTMAPAGRHVEVRPRTVPGLTDGVIDALVAGGDALTSPMSAVYTHRLHGAAARVPVSDMAFAMRTPHMLVESVAAWAPAEPAARHRDWARALSDSLSAEALPGGYVNMLAADEHDQIAHAYGPNRDRLLAAKRTYDPDGVFHASPLPVVS